MIRDQNGKEYSWRNRWGMPRWVFWVVFVPACFIAIQVGIHLVG